MFGSRRQYLYVILIFILLSVLKLTLLKVFHPTPLLSLPLTVLYCAWFFQRGPGYLMATLCAALMTYLLLVDDAYLSPHGSAILVSIQTSVPCISLFVATWFINYIKWQGDSRIKWGESQRQILSALENLEGGAAAACLDEDFNIATWGIGAERMTGWSSEEVVGDTIHKFFVGEDIRSNLPKSLFEAVKTKGVWTGILRSVRKGGSRFWVIALFARLKVGYLAIAIDVTEQKNNEESLERWRNIFNHGGWNVCVIDAKSNAITHVNSAFVKAYGYESAEELIGKPMVVLLAPEFNDIQKHLQAMHMSEGNDYIYETVHVRKDGVRFPVQIHISLFRDDNGLPIYRAAICEDITSRRKLERDARHSKEELRRAAERKDAFLAILAHELRNPLQPIRTAVSIYKEKGILEQDMMNRIDRSVNQIQRHVDDLMDVARINTGKMQLEKSSVDIRHIIHDAIEQVHPSLKAKGHNLLTSLPDQPVYLDGDPTRLQQIIANLLNNAIKYTQEKGTIWITVEVFIEELAVKIRDTGIGISKEILPKVFDLYMQGNSSTTKLNSGLGLGLTLVKHLLELHGGKISAESESGKGSTFTVHLPINKPQEALPPASSPAEGSSNGDTHCNRKILVVDDNVDAAVSLQMMFAMDGCNVVVANDGEEALRTYEGFRPDIVLLDIGLPKIDGYEVARRIRAVSDSVTLIAVTGYGQPTDAKRSTEAGFDAHVVKPVEPCRFKKLVNTKFEARTQRSGNHVQVSEQPISH